VARPDRGVVAGGRGEFKTLERAARDGEEMALSIEAITDLKIIDFCKP